MGMPIDQRGITTVEFALVAVVFFTVLFGLIDMSRLYFDMAALDEATRRGARLAAVCPIGDPQIAETAIFSNGGQSVLVPGLQTQHINLQYLDEDGDAIASPSTAPGYGQIRYVRVSIQNFQVQTFIPFMTQVITLPAFQTTIPGESLGRVGIADIAC